MPTEDLRKLIYAGEPVGYAKKGDEIQFLDGDGFLPWSRSVHHSVFREDRLILQNRRKDKVSSDIWLVNS